LTAYIASGPTRIPQLSPLFIPFCAVFWRPEFWFTYESPPCQVPILNIFFIRFLFNSGHGDTLPTDWPGIGECSPSNPGTAAAAEMREAPVAGPPVWLPVRSSSPHQALSVRVRGGSPVLSNCFSFPFLPWTFSSICAPDCGLQSEESPIRHSIGRSILSSRVSQSQQRPLQGENDYALTRYWTKLPELTSARSNPFSA